MSILSVSIEAIANNPPAVCFVLGFLSLMTGNVQFAIVFIGVGALLQILWLRR